MIIPGLALTASMFNPTGWEGYSWPVSTSKVFAEFTVPTVRPPNGAVAFWAGFGKGNPGIQQDGLECGELNGFGGCSPWYEMWSAEAHALPGTVKAGDHMKFYVAHTGDDYVLQVFDLTRHWTDTVHAEYGSHENSGEAIAEAFGQPLPGFTAASFSHASGTFQQLYKFPFAGTSIVKDSPTSFTVHRL